MELWLTPLAPSERQHGYAELSFHITHGAGMGWDGVVIVSMFPSLIHFSTTEILLGTLPTELNLNTSISPRPFWDTEHSCSHCVPWRQQGASMTRIILDLHCVSSPRLSSALAGPDQTCTQYLTLRIGSACEDKQWQPEF